MFFNKSKKNDLKPGSGSESGTACRAHQLIWGRFGLLGSSGVIWGPSGVWVWVWLPELYSKPQTVANP